MSELEDARDHARAMADWRDPREGATAMSAWCDGRKINLLPNHGNCNGWTAGTFRARPHNATLCACDCHPRDPGPSDRDRKLWRALADEIDAYLAADHDEEALW